MTAASHAPPAHGPLGTLYDLVTGDEDARVCKDIPDAACNDQPRNFFVYLVANLLTKVCDELASAKLVLPWLLSALGAPAAFAGFLVPLREGGVLLPQLVVAAYIRRLPLRKTVWILGSVLSGITTALMALAALTLTGAAAGWAIVGLLAVFSLSRGLNSVSAKDVLGKTVSKTRRGTLMGWSAGIAGAATLGLGVYIQTFAADTDTTTLFFGLLAVAAGLWFLSAGVFAAIREVPGATEGGGNALGEAIKSLGMLRSDAAFRHFVVTRILLLGVALAPPFYVILAQQHTGDGLAGLGMLIIASGIAASVSSPVWGRLGDRSARLVMVLAAGGAGLLGIAVFALLAMDAPFMGAELTYALLFLALSVFHAGVRLGRKVYLVDLASAQTRAAYVAISNTVIGAAMLVGGLVGVLGDILGIPAVVLLLGLVSLAAAAYAWRLPEVSG
jgi:hypothetical protein